MRGPHDDGDTGSPASRNPPPDAARSPAATADRDTVRDEGTAPEDASESAPRAGDRRLAFDGGTDSLATEEGPESTGSVVGAVDDPELDAMLGDRNTLHGRVRYQWVLNYLVPAVFLAAIVSYAALTFEVVDALQGAVGVGAGVVAIVMLYALVRAVFLYRSWRYVVREDSLYLARGVFTIVQTVVPYVRVQHIDTRRTAFERALGLSSLVVYTAGSRGADVTIPGLTPERAEELQAYLKRLAIESEDEDAV